MTTKEAKLVLPRYYKRTFTKPKVLREDDWQNRKYESHWEHNVDQYDRETETRRETVTVNDVFYREIGTEEWKYGYSYKSVSGQAKYPCIGGPLNGQREVIGTEEYVSYNCAQNPRWGKKEWPTNVLIHKSLLPET